MTATLTVQWEQATSDKGNTFEVGSVADEVPADAGIELFSGATFCCTAPTTADVRWEPRADSNWVRVPQNLGSQTGITAYRLTQRSPADRDVLLEFHTYANFVYTFTDHAGDSYTDNRQRVGRHSLRFNSEDPTIMWIVLRGQRGSTGEILLMLGISSEYYDRTSAGSARTLHVPCTHTMTLSHKLLDQVRQLIPPLTGALHKGQAGRVAVVGGAEEYSGAPFFAASSALRVGADLSHVLCSPVAAGSIKAYSPDLIVRPVVAADVAPDRPDVVKGYQSAVLTPSVVEYGRLCETLSSFGAFRPADTGESGGVAALQKGPEDVIAYAQDETKVDAQCSMKRCGGWADILSGAVGAFLAWGKHYETATSG
ncbi:Ribokinase-like protein [Auricularia subglabra TFB-10046 SS5]|nr:Ribokinase-like protein [Auricularia subglabra TFB-10046 SS5]